MQKGTEVDSNRRYWHAGGLTDGLLERFARARSKNNDSGMRNAFFMVARYYARTLSLSRKAVKTRDEDLTAATWRNLPIFDAALGRMHRDAPEVVPLAVPLTEGLRDRWLRGLLVRILEGGGVLSLNDLMEALAGFGKFGEAAEEDVEARLAELVGIGTVVRSDGGWRRTGGSSEITVGNGILRSLLGDDLAAELADAGVEKTIEAVRQAPMFIATLSRLTGFSEVTAALLVEVLRNFIDEEQAISPEWRHRDLLHSAIPRPYQLEAYAVFSGLNYQGLVVEAPTGSGKTLIGMLCIQDWLRRLNVGESIVVAVPTTNYQQQWVRELCYNDHGLGLPPELVFAGPPADLMRYCRKFGPPPVVVVTYAGLAQTRGADDGKAALKRMLEAVGVKWVILDEAHKVAEDLRSPTAAAVSDFSEALAGGRLDGLIGFTGTGDAYEPVLNQLGLRLVHRISMIELIAYGYVAPFTEFGVPFAWSDRERTIMALLADYKVQLQSFLAMAGGSALRAAFAAVPIADRVRIARDLLGVYQGRADGDAAAERLMHNWESGSDLKLPEIGLVSILQIATNKTCTDLIGSPTSAEFATLLERLRTIRTQLAGLIVLPRFVNMVQGDGFGELIAAAELKALMTDATVSRTERKRRAETLLGTTITGLYDGLSAWYQHVGEGRVSAVKATMAAERATRNVSGTIIFDRGRRLYWRDNETALPGFDGVAGLFAQLLGDPHVVPIAAQSQEIYLPVLPDCDVRETVAIFIRDSLMLDELADAITGLLTADLAFGETLHHAFRVECGQALAVFAEALTTRGRQPAKLFAETFLRPLRDAWCRRRHGVGRPVAKRLRSRLKAANPHLRTLMRTFVDYAEMMRSWRAAPQRELIQAGGQRQSFVVVKMPGGRKQQLSYDLVARLVDAPELAFNTVIVSSWARTGWNVIRPNLLIDATATRNVTAWQQLRGRAMRARRTWTNDCYRAMTMLLGTHALGLSGDDLHLPPAVHEIYADIQAATDKPILGESTLRLIAALCTPEEKELLHAGGVRRLPPKRRGELAVALMLKHNKVTHVHELVKAYGSTSQVTLKRATGAWIRRENIALKHAHEVAVDLTTGKLATGDVHAPLIYANDPRHDAPADLQAAIAARIRNCDPLIVQAWINAVVDA